MAASRVITPPGEAKGLVSKGNVLANARRAGRAGTSKSAGQGAVLRYLSGGSSDNPLSRELRA